MLPEVALIGGYALARLAPPARWWEMLLLAFGFLAMPTILAYASTRPAALDLPGWSASLPVWPIVVSALACPLLLAFARGKTLTQVRALAFGVFGASVLIGGGIVPSIAPY